MEPEPGMRYSEREKVFKESTIEEFERLRDECLREGRLFEDPEFPAHKSSIVCPETHPEGAIPLDFITKIKWKRPKDICEDPRLVIDGHSRFDVRQGRLGNCWFIASASILASHCELLGQVLPKGQGFKENYAGIFHFRFWQYGRWVTVIIDDRLPVYDEIIPNLDIASWVRRWIGDPSVKRNDLVFMDSSKDNEFWAALLEKAYAKLHGSYYVLEAGSTAVGLEDLTGGLAEVFEIAKFENKNKELFKIMRLAQERGALMGCGANPKSEEIEEKYGIPGGHAYSVTDVKNIKIATSEGIKRKRMVRVRNPWGNQVEWTGAWSDESSEWNNVSEEVKNKLDLKVRDDGEYWMEIQDFCKHFDVVELCHLDAAVDIDSAGERKWEMSTFNGSWEEGVSAGGCSEFGTDYFCKNPQYRLTLHEYDDICEDDNDDDDDTVIISLILKFGRAEITPDEHRNIGYSIYKITQKDKISGSFDGSFFEDAHRVAHAGAVANGPMRTHTKRFKLLPGDYCVVPYKIFPDSPGEFFLRIYTEKRQTANELKKAN